MTRFSSTILFLFLGFTLLPHAGRAQTHFADCISRTESNATIVVPAGIAPRVGGATIEPGDEIAVLASDGTCTGVAVWTGADLSIVVWGDDSMTSAKDGLEPDEAMLFRVWDASASARLDSVTVTYSGAKTYYRTRNTFAPNALFVVTKLEADSVTIAQPPPAPQLASPANGESDVQLDPRLVWRRSPGAKSYRVQVATDPHFLSIMYDQSGISDSTFSLSGLTQSSNYSWRVSARNDGGVSDFSSARTFSTLYTGDSNTPPSFFSKPVVRAKADRAYAYAVLATDADGDALTVSAARLPAWLRFDTDGGPTGELTGTPSEAEVGDHAVELQATDVHGARSMQSFTVSVAPSKGNTAPRAVGRVPKKDAVAGEETLTMRLSAIFEDDDGDVLVYEATTDVAGIVDVTINDDELLIVPLSAGTAVVEITAVDESGATGSTSFEVTVAATSHRERTVPQSFSLEQNYPNPFNPHTTIVYTIEHAGDVELVLYNQLGHRIRTLQRGFRAPGTHAVSLDASALPSGIYIYRLSFAGGTQARMMVLMR